MKRRNAETGKMRRPIKRTKITEGMYGDSMLYLKFVMLWAVVVLADYMLEFRFEFLWPFWMMFRSICDSFKYQGIAFSLFFMCIVMTSDFICLLFIPMPWIFIAASSYVWVQYVWYTVADRGYCLPTAALCCFIAYVEGALRAADRGGGMSGAGIELCRPLAAHCVGYPVVTLGFGFKSYVGHRLRLRRQRQVRAQNEFYYQLMRDALPESALEENQPEPSPKPSTKECSKEQPGERHVPNGAVDTHTHKDSNTQTEHKHMNGSAAHAHAKSKKCSSSSRLEQNGVLSHEHSVLQLKLERLEKHLLQNSSSGGSSGSQPAAAAREKPQHSTSNGSVTSSASSLDLITIDSCKAGSAKSSKCDKKENPPPPAAATHTREEKKRNKNRDKDRESDSHTHRGTDSKEAVKEVESTKESTKTNSSQNKEKEKEKEREKELQREREREQREARECTEELRRVRAELAAVRCSEAEARRALAAAAAADRQRRAEHLQLRHAHQALQHKLTSWRGTERAAMERRLGEERRARTSLEQQLLKAQQLATKQRTGECENEQCISSRGSMESELLALRRDLQRARDRATRVSRDLSSAQDQLRSMEQRQEEGGSPQSRLAAAFQSLQERAAHLERSLSAETRVKLDLLSALGEAKRQLTIREGVMTKMEKEIEELKAQMLAVMPASYVTTASGSVSKLRLSDGTPLDPNASVYTPKQLCSDA